MARAWGLLALALSPAGAFKLNILGSNVTVARYSARPAIRWAVAPDFYELLLPRLGVESGFPLSSSSYYTSRERVHAALAQAFDVWQANSPSLRFVDVTERCTAERLWLPVQDRQCYSSPWCVNYEATGPLGDNWEDGETDLDALSECTFATCLECERADIVVGGFYQHNRGLADHVEARVAQRVLSQMPPLGFSGAPLEGQTLSGAGATSGGAVSGGSGGFLQFNLDNKTSFNASGTPSLQAKCWRLDSDMCGWLGVLDPDPYTAAAAVFGLSWAICLIVFLYGLMTLIQRLAANLLQGWDMDADGKLEIQEVIYVLDEFCGDICFECRCPTVHSKEMSPLSGILGVLETLTTFALLPTVLTITLLIGLPLAFFSHLVPCWSCNDLRAAAVHEIGHLLGLGHADMAGGVALNASVTQNCTSMASGLLPHTSYVSLMSTIGLLTDSELAPRRCLTLDDLEGLSFLYPSCAGEMLKAAACPVHFGDQATWLRLLESFFWIAWPVILAVCGIKIFSVVVLWVLDALANRRLKGISKKIISSLGKKASKSRTLLSPRGLLSPRAQSPLAARAQSGRTLTERLRGTGSLQ